MVVWNITQVRSREFSKTILINLGPGASGSEATKAWEAPIVLNKYLVI